MTDISRPPKSSRQQPWSWAEALSDAKPVEQEIVIMGDGSMHNYVAPGSLHDQLGREHVSLTRARSEGSAATHDQQTWGEFGGSNQPSEHNKPGV